MKQHVSIIGENPSSLPSLKGVARVSKNIMEETFVLILYTNGPPGNYVNALFDFSRFSGKNPDLCYVVTSPDYSYNWSSVVKKSGIPVIASKKPGEEILKICKIKSVLEHKFYREMLRLGFVSIEPQMEVGGFEYDFVFKEKKLLIEIDSNKYHASPEKQTHDAKKMRSAQVHGWFLFRFTDMELNSNFKEVVESIRKFVR